MEPTLGIFQFQKIKTNNNEPITNTANRKSQQVNEQIKENEK